jgi:hypothetical protein
MNLPKLKPAVSERSVFGSIEDWNLKVNQQKYLEGSDRSSDRSRIGTLGKKYAFLGFSRSDRSSDRSRIGTSRPSTSPTLDKVAIGLRIDRGLELRR